MGVRARTTYFRSQTLDGWLHSLALSFDPSTRLHLELSGGARLEHECLGGPLEILDPVDGTGSRHEPGELLVSDGVGERRAGGAAPTSEIFGGLSVRF